MKFFASAAALLAASAASASMLRTTDLSPPKLIAEDLNFDEVARSVPSDGSGPASVLATHGAGTFQQAVDHSDPSQGNFTQRFWWSSQFWTGPGAPVVFFTPGEEAADGYTGYLTNRTITGQFAQAIGGAVVLLEHRYWGTSTPFTELTTKNLRFLTLANAIADVTHFARTVELPFDTTGASNAPAAPWVMSGGSYSGALTAWVNQVAPGTFWAYHASSAVVQTIEDFWQYFDPVRQGLPQNCSADVQRVVEYVDGVLKTGTETEVQALKDTFGLGGIKHSDDFASALAGGLWAWQSHDFDSGYSYVYQFCDYIENAVSGVFNRTGCHSGLPGAQGVGLKRALKGYAKWASEIMLPNSCSSTGYFTGEYNVDCYDTHNASNPYFTDISMNNAAGRQWTWLLCNEPFMFWQDGAPEGTPTVVSRFLNTTYWERQCQLYFPTDAEGYSYGSALGRTPADVNAYTGGWDAVNTTRLIWANGEFDPWKDATVSSEFRPGGPLQSTAEAPVNIIPGGIHCSDLIYANGLANAGVMAVIEKEVAVIKGWVEEFYAAKNKTLATPTKARRDM